MLIFSKNNIKLDDLKVSNESSNGFKIGESGLYEVKVASNIIKHNTSGSKTLELKLVNNGTENVVFTTLINKDGKLNSVTQKLINKLVIVSNKDMVLGGESIQGLNGLDFIAYIQVEYSKYNDKINKRLNILDVFGLNKLSAMEIFKGIKDGKDYDSIANNEYGQLEIKYTNCSVEEVLAMKEEFKLNNKYNSNDNVVNTTKEEYEDLPF